MGAHAVRGRLGARALAGLAAAGALAVAVVAAAPPATAAVVDRGTYSDTYAYEYGECGYPVQVEGERSGRYVVRQDRDAAAPLLGDVYEYTEVHTRADTGERFVVRGHGTTRDVAVTGLGDGLVRVRSLDAGQPFVVADVDGRVVARDRGAISSTYVLDADGQFVELLDQRVAGPHPGFDTGICRAAGELVGTGSGDRLTARPAGTTASPLGYQEYLPPGYGDEPRPLLVVLHGYDEGGDGSAAALPNLLATGVPWLIDVDGWPAARPFVVLAPQHDFPAPDPAFDACADVEWFGSCSARVQHDLGHPEGTSPCTTPDEVRGFLEYALEAYDVDPTRVFLTGLSCGGVGVWEYLAQGEGPAVRGAVPIATDGRPSWDAAGCDLTDTATWVFHGDADDVMDPRGATETAAHLQGCPTPPARESRLTVYPGVDHDSWSRTYDLTAGNDVYAWMLALP